MLLQWWKSQPIIIKIDVSNVNRNLMIILIKWVLWVESSEIIKHLKNVPTLYYLFILFYFTVKGAPDCKKKKKNHMKTPANPVCLASAISIYP